MKTREVCSCLEYFVTLNTKYFYIIIYTTVFLLRKYDIKIFYGIIFLSKIYSISETESFKLDECKSYSNDKWTILNKKIFYLFYQLSFVQKINSMRLELEPVLILSFSEIFFTPTAAVSHWYLNSWYIHIIIVFVFNNKNSFDENKTLDQ